MKALSIRQPWAWLILHAGKDIENRTWGPHYPALREAQDLARSGERILIHAAKGMTRDEYEDAIDVAKAANRIRPFQTGLTLSPFVPFADLERGGIVGSARIHRVVTNHTSPWFFGPIGLVLTDVEPLPFRPCKGALGFFVPEMEAVGTELFGANPRDGAAGEGLKR